MAQFFNMHFQLAHSLFCRALWTKEQDILGYVFFLKKNLQSEDPLGENIAHVKGRKVVTSNIMIIHQAQI